MHAYSSALFNYGWKNIKNANSILALIARNMSTLVRILNVSFNVKQQQHLINLIIFLVS